MACNQWVPRNILLIPMLKTLLQDEESGMKESLLVLTITVFDTHIYCIKNKNTTKNIVLFQLLLL